MDVDTLVTTRPRLVHLTLAGLLFLPAGARPEPQSAASPRWQITRMRIAAAGRTTAADEGRRVAGVVFEGDARAARGAFAFDRGIFRLTLSGFSPAVSSEDRKAGDWYLEGDWTITFARPSAGVKTVGLGAGEGSGGIPETDPTPPMIRGSVTGVCGRASFWPFNGVVRTAGMLVNGRLFAEVPGTFEGRVDASALMVFNLPTGISSR